MSKCEGPTENYVDLAGEAARYARTKNVLGVFHNTRQVLMVHTHRGACAQRTWIRTLQNSNRNRATSAARMPCTHVGHVHVHNRDQLGSLHFLRLHNFQNRSTAFWMWGDGTLTTAKNRPSLSSLFNVTATLGDFQIYLGVRGTIEWGDTVPFCTGSAVLYCAVLFVLSVLK